MSTKLIIMIALGVLILGGLMMLSFILPEKVKVKDKKGARAGGAGGTGGVGSDLEKIDEETFEKIMYRFFPEHLIEFDEGLETRYYERGRFDADVIIVMSRYNVRRDETEYYLNRFYKKLKKRWARFPRR